MVAKSAALRTTPEDAEMEKALLVKMEALGDVCGRYEIIC
jgi:hypothetical protein